MNEKTKLSCECYKNNAYSDERKHCPACGKFMKYVYDTGPKWNMPDDYHESYWLCKCGVTIDVFP